MKPSNHNTTSAFELTNRRAQFSTPASTVSVKVGCITPQSPHQLQFDSFSGEEARYRSSFTFSWVSARISLWVWGYLTQKPVTRSPHTTAPWAKRKRSGERRKVRVFWTLVVSLPFKDSVYHGSVSLGFDIHRVGPGVTARTWLEQCLINALPLESTAWTDAHLQMQVEHQFMMLWSRPRCVQRSNLVKC